MFVFIHRAVLASILAGGLAATPALAQTSKGDRELGQYLSSECVTCHQLSGKQSEGVPAIVGWPEDQFVAVMRAYKNRERENAVMRTIAGRLSQPDIEALAAYFGSLPKPAAP